MVIGIHMSNSTLRIYAPGAVPDKPWDKDSSSGIMNKGKKKDIKPFPLSLEMLCAYFLFHQNFAGLKDNMLYLCEIFTEVHWFKKKHLFLEDRNENQQSLSGFSAETRVASQFYLPAQGVEEGRKQERETEVFH